MRIIRGSLLLFLVLSALATLRAQEIDMDAANAAGEFRWGIIAFHNGLFGESIRAFERALAFTPENRRIQEWLGHAYYRSGYEDTALSIWDEVLESNEATPLLKNLADTVRARRGLAGELVEDLRYVNAFSLAGEQPDFTLFSRPASVFPRDDGSFFLTSFAGNEVLRFSANGALQQRILGGIHGLDHPFDVVEIPGRYIFISEFLGHSIVRTNSSGTDVFRFAEKGNGDGELIGPQFMATDNKGYLYVAETGNRRISKFDYDGNFILSFGTKEGNFSGLKSPTGICVHSGKVYVADALDKVIHIFDPSGNYYGRVGEGELLSPEGVSVYSDRELLVADGKRVLSYNVDLESFSPLTDLDNEGRRITKAVVDVNGDLIVSDFTANTVTMLTEIANIYTGLFVQVQRVLSDEYPTVYLELSVEDRMGNPYLGLDESNFIISELRGRVSNDSFLNPPESRLLAVSLLIDRSEGMEAHSDAAMEAASSVYDFVSGEAGSLTLVTAGEQPAKQGTMALTKERFSAAAANADILSDSSRFSLGLRLAASEVIGWPGVSAVVFVTDGDLGDLAFDDYSLEIIAAYMRNNGVAFYCVYLTPDPLNSKELEYLCDTTNGSSRYIYAKEGLGPLLEEMSSRQTGRYFFSYESVQNPEFGDRFLSVEVEVFHFKRSGRAESGYFAPRQ